MVTRLQLKKRFESVRKRASKQHEEKHKLDLEMEQYFGFHFSDKKNLVDNDMIIDTLDYGTSSLSFKNFEKMMTTNTLTETNEILTSHNLKFPSNEENNG